MISWIGGKNRQAKWIYEETLNNVIKNTENYVELFGGAFWTYLKTDIYNNVNNIYYNDKNKFLVNLFYCVKYKREDLLKELNKYQSKDIETFNKFKDLFFNEYINEDFEIGDIKVAVIYVYLHLHIFSGSALNQTSKLVKDNKTDKYQSFIKKVSGTTKSIKNFIDKIDNIKSINNKDYKEVVKELDNKETLFYVDPPYFGKEKYYGFNDFDKTKHKELAQVLQNIKGKFVLSYYYFEGIEEFYPKNKFYYFQKEFTKTSSKKDKKDKGIEILITNFNPKIKEVEIVAVEPVNNTNSISNKLVA